DKCQRKSVRVMSPRDMRPSRGDRLPSEPARFCHFGFTGSAGGAIGLKAMWQAPQVMPTRYGGSYLRGSSKNSPAFHRVRSNFGFGESRRPMTPEAYGSAHRSR